jgi:hypothetical protein
MRCAGFAKYTVPSRVGQAGEGVGHSFRQLQRAPGG